MIFAALVFLSNLSGGGTHSAIPAALTGGGSALVVSYLWVKSLMEDKKILRETLEKKDAELHEVAMQSLECITLVRSDSQSHKEQFERIEALMAHIRSHLEANA